MKPLKAANSTLHEFAESTTIHGIAYVFDRAIKGLDNTLWFLVVCFGAGVAVYMSLDAWNTWKDAPVLTSVSSTGLPLRKIEFPAITICSQGLIQVIFSFSALFQNILKSGLHFKLFLNSVNEIVCLAAFMQINYQHFEVYFDLGNQIILSNHF